MKKLMMVAFVALVVGACSKKTKSCDDIFEHTKSLAPAAMQAAMEQKKETAIAKCEKMSDEAKQCAGDAKSIEDLQKCPRE